MTVPDTKPARIARLDHDRHGRPIPWFVDRHADKANGDPDFRIADGLRALKAYKDRLCWVCGGKLTRHAVFVVGPMCVVNRVSAEPPSHIDCAHYSVTHCPFLTQPKMRRNEKGLPEDFASPGGVMIDRNPGVTALWITKDWRIQSDGAGGFVYRFGPPSQVHWFSQGRDATRAEVEASITSGLPALEALSESSAQWQHFQEMVEAATAYLPPVVASSWY